MIENLLNIRGIPVLEVGLGVEIEAEIIMVAVAEGEGLLHGQEEGDIGHIQDQGLHQDQNHREKEQKQDVQVVHPTHQSLRAKDALHPHQVQARLEVGHH